MNTNSSSHGKSATYGVVWIRTLCFSKAVKPLDLIADAACQFHDLLPGALATVNVEFRDIEDLARFGELRSQYVLLLVGVIEDLFDFVAS